ncbi:hypothetical protein Pmar_PMAR011899 [Perkinsus marinus ATCC 50983]|uniref:Uncharacterized protein n=1 Tax=Perkinsus marinus (strain ATCC 50983 / TXsc) TaxID=423536 RepID=C5LBM6_PERM5|nr:hypothetical protein Pmar_PMAR011899 [Perkinsus marinus ATCC 50983]EER05847.1 hypothetical protein Pmar_PMAR011899 [Perkinsus marinus ATCC 50983]|eukprot:XP_002774031.1 hypothetical protein Pmar_PMAR011899 [Perkinsus marinus ATCC 50983]
MVEMGGSLDPLVSTASASVFPHGSPLHMRKYVDGMFIGGRGEGNIREGEMLLGADSARGSSSGGIEDVRTVIGKLIMMGMATDESRERQVGAHSETLDERARRSLDSEGLLSLVESQLLPLMENRKALSKMREPEGLDGVVVGEVISRRRGRRSTWRSERGRGRRNGRGNSNVL